MGEEFVLGATEVIPIARPTVVSDRERDKFTQLHDELMGYYFEMKQFNRMDSVDVFEKLSAWTARASEIRTDIVRFDSRKSSTFRTKQLEPFIDECDRQFRFHSRITAIHELDAKLAGGRFT